MKGSPGAMQPAWWKEAIVYQIYPYSFRDTTGTGIGDLNGITSKLPYLRDLGVDVVWLSPIYASPMKDMGYDISDYRAIHPEMGTMEDWETLVGQAHDLGLKVVMDLVVNHTSDQHAWFQESRKGGAKKGWYIWRPAKDGKEPNNWGAIFGGSCWEWDEQLQEYYLHVFDTSQPDLNWENPAVREAVWDIMRFWLDKGCDGFRMDVINCISKEPGLPDVPITDLEMEFQYGLLHRFNGPRVHEYLQEMNERVLKHYPHAFTVGETPGVNTPAKAIEYVQDARELQMIFHFEHMYMDIEPGKKCFYHRGWKLTELKNILGTWMEYMQEHRGWDSLYLENHDQPRILGRWANDTTHRLESAKMLAIFHATGRGTVYLYQGQEMGMANPKHWTYEELRDLEEINFYDEEKRKRAEGAGMGDVLARIQVIGRDNARTPMQWDDSRSAGFTTGAPWIKVNEDYKAWNVAKQEGDSGSVLVFWKTLLKVRKERRGLVYGYFKMLDRGNEQVYAYTRTDDRYEYLVVCSFSGETVLWDCPVERGELLLSNYSVGEGEVDNQMSLRAYEGRLYCRKM
ncbi:MAG: glycoside hydrolase family 13 [Lasallia pustulata]|uniref:Glycoside hydrolase family 13 n=1 Tax=Lasallia pustulata TaxID=136370 RepID=A0A5M8PMB6_9LECA|nr:MAG: glycoside hydrolase family 13 [Lasallia pustulata]